jgi:hypothetical protein
MGLKVMEFSAAALMYFYTGTDRRRTHIVCRNRQGPPRAEIDQLHQRAKFVAKEFQS